MREIVSITREVREESVLPDGYYLGVWGGFKITLHYKDTEYLLKTSDGAKGTRIRVVIIVKEGDATFHILNN